MNNIIMEPIKLIIRNGRVYAPGIQSIRRLRKQKKRVNLIIEEIRRARYLNHLRSNK